jgi:rubredoxin
VANLRCPECGANLQLAPANVPEHAICPECAAIGFFDQKKRFYRLPKTQEWLDMVTLTGFWDILDARQRVVDRLMARSPRPPMQGHVDGPRITPKRPG